MRQYTATTAPGRLLRASRRTLARLKANPKAKALVGKLQPAHDGLKDAQQVWIRADDEALDAGAAVDECDALARDALTHFQLELLLAVRRDYRDPLYVSFFPAGFDAAKARSGLALRTTLQTICDRLGSQPVDARLKEHAEPLAAAIRALETPLASAATAEQRLADAGTALNVARESWLTAWDALAGALREAFPRRKAFVDGFFPKAAAKKGKKVEPEEQDAVE